jgi:hypothetical protein
MPPSRRRMIFKACIARANSPALFGSILYSIVTRTGPSSGLGSMTMLPPACVVWDVGCARGMQSWSIESQSLLLPTTTECPIELNQHQEFVASGLG